MIIWPVSWNHFSHLIDYRSHTSLKKSNVTIDPPALSKGSTHTLLGPCRCESGWPTSQNIREPPTGPNWQQRHTPASACGHAQYRPPHPSQTWPPATAASASPSCLQPDGCCLGCRSTASSPQRSAAQRWRHFIKWVNKGQHTHPLTMPFSSVHCLPSAFILSVFWFVGKRNLHRDKRPV